jgi:lipopolysaccharide transport system ATP-binding protein
MSDIAIKAEGLSKLYRIGGRQEKYRTLRDTIADILTSPFRRLAPSADDDSDSKQQNAFWALKDVSFEIRKGEVAGIIGRNGAGKSTLLKVLSRITEPTSGYAEIRGRVRSLLEVGTGFHQELTGRENIALNGAILGMKRAEIERKFDEIVAFAEVEKFIDTPVKRYSSGMYLRLAFAVAAHLESEILLVDEVLAVGDAAFQRKCLGKMGEVARQGRTVLFVSHNMSAVKELCRRGILLDAGNIVFQGDSTQSIAEYMRRLEESPVTIETGSRQLVFGPVRICSRLGNCIVSGEPFKVTLPVAGRQTRNPAMFFIVEDFTGNTVIHSRVNSRDAGVETIDGAYQIDLDFPALWLAPGIYSAYFKFLIPDAADLSGRFLTEKVTVEVQGEFGSFGKAILNPTIEWQMESNSSKAHKHVSS